MLPNFIVVGAPKSATTSLYYYLKQHPEVYVSPIKEPLFFSFVGQKPNYGGPHGEKKNEEIITDLARYESLYDGVQDEKAVGECSACYLYFPQTPENIKQYVPDCKIIITLRNPVDRAFSNYLMHVMLNYEDLSFEEALAAEKERLALNWRWSFDYTGQSLYYEAVKRYLDLFGKDKVRVYLFEDFKVDPAGTMKDVCAFLGVDSEFDGFDFKVHNPSGKPRSGALYRFLYQPNLIKSVTRPFTSKEVRRTIRQKLKWYVDTRHAFKEEKPAMAPETQAQLVEFFRDDVTKLQALIGRDLSSWLELHPQAQATTTTH